MKNTLYCGDNLDVLRKNIKDESVDLIYIDPPFFSNRHYEVVWGDEAEIRSFEDRWEGGVNVYIGWMRPRVEELHRVLKPTGSLYLHCDWHANAHLRIMMDDIFGPKNFRNEIAWCYKTREFSKKYWNRKHDNILFYVKNARSSYPFNWNVEAIMESYSLQTIKKYKYKDEKGRYRLVGRGIKGSPIQSAKDVSPDWEKTHPELVARNYLGKGYPPFDYWFMDIINQAAKERLGYPTQKPEALLERIIKASSNKGYIVLDAFCGCGTTLVVAQKLGRNWIGIDISPTAAGIMEDRLKKVGAIKNSDYITIGTPTTVNELRQLKPFEFQNWVINELGARQSRKKVGDMGLDGHFVKDLWHDEAGIQVKQSDGVGRNVIDNFKAALERKKYKKGFIIAFSFTKGSYEEVARIKHSGELQIKLVEVEVLLLKKKPIE